MFCPQCGQQQVSEETRFCSRCGFLLIAVADIVARGGALPEHLIPQDQLTTPRKHGLKQGLFILLSGFLIVPIIIAISIFLRIGPTLAMMATFLLAVGALLRMAYALLFESNAQIPWESESGVAGIAKNLLHKKAPQSLPAATSIPASDYFPPPSRDWMDTNDLATPSSVTEKTTRLLEKDQ